MQESAVQESKTIYLYYVFCHAHHVAESFSFGMQMTFETTSVSNVCNVICVKSKIDDMIGIVAY